MVPNLIGILGLVVRIKWFETLGLAWSSARNEIIVVIAVDHNYQHLFRIRAPWFLAPCHFLQWVIVPTKPCGAVGSSCP